MKYIKDIIWHQNKRKIFILLILNILILKTNLFVQENQIKFEHISTEHGLSESTVTSIFQDKVGFLWIGTEDGLNKYDGYSFTIYKTDSERENEISSNEITSIYENKNGVLWIGTEGGGLNKFDRNTEQFYHYKNDPNNPNSISSDDIASIHEDFNGVLWIGTEGGGLNKFDRNTEQFYHYKNDPNNPYSISNDEVDSIYEDRNGILWIGTEGGGLNKFIHKTEQFYHYKNDPNNPHSISSDDVYTIYEDKNGVLWIGTADGLNIFNQEKEEFTRYKKNINDPNSLSYDEIETIFIDKADVVWIGTDGGGLNKFAHNTKKYLHYYKNTNVTNSLSHNKVWGFYEDRNGIIWIGTEDGGLNKFDRNIKQFYHYKNDPNNPNSLSYDEVTSICEDNNGVLWIGTDGGGLNKFDRNTEQFYHYKNDPNNPNSISSDEVIIIFKDHMGILWIGTEGGGLNKFDPNTEQFYHYKNDPNNPNSLSYDEITSICEENNKVLWIGTEGGGLNKFDRNTEQFIVYKHDINNPNSLSHDKVWTIYKDHTGILWIGTNNGLSKFDQLNGSFSSYKEKDGFQNDIVYGILEDTKGFLWISTENGLSKFDPKMEIIRNYDVRDGLQNNKFVRGSYYINNKGEMFFGGIFGFNIFNPDDINYNQEIPAIVITDFKIFNESTNLYNRDNIKTSINVIKEITLYYKENVFSFEFAALDFTIPERNQYAYKMEGFDKEWIYSGGRRFVTYTNLNPGEYIFKVKGSNSDYFWNEQGTSIKIKIIPPYWKTWWFYLFCIIIILAITYTIFNLRIKQLKAQHQAIILKNEVRVSNKLQKQLKQFVSDVSHEFKTPLSIMRLSIESVVNAKKITMVEKEKMSKTLEIIYSMDFLVKKLLILSRIESDNFNFKFKPANLNEILKKVHENLILFANEKKIKFKLNLPSKNITLISEKDLLFIALFNIVENAIKYTEKGHVILSAEHHKDNIKIIVDDTGVGITKKEIKKIFDRFYRGSYSRKQTKGYGIGLSISKRIIEIHKGLIKIESIINTKTKFIIQLPKE